MNDLTAPWRQLARSIGLPEPEISWTLRGEALHPLSSQTFRSATAEATLVRATQGWEIRYRNELTCRIQRRDGLAISFAGFLPESAHHATLLAGPITALIMSACGYYPIHAAGLHLGSRLFVVHATSGQGKSTLAACAARHGVAIAGDDLLAVDSAGNIPGLSGALRIPPALAPEGWTPRRILPDGRGWFPLPAAESRPLAAVLLLERGSEIRVLPERGTGRLIAMMRAGSLSHLVSDPPSHWHLVIDHLAARVPAWRLQVPEGLDRLDSAWPAIRQAIENAVAS